MMALDDHAPVPRPPSPLPSGGSYTVIINEGERQVLILALGELLQSAERGEHLIPTVRSLLDRLQAMQTGV